MKIISAGAGSGKTYRLTQEMVALLQSKEVRPNGIIATTFTNKAAAELQERVRIKLLEEGLTEAADELANALIGTVHGLGVKLLKRFAFEAGVSPEVAIMADEDQQLMFNQSLSTVLTNKRIIHMEQLADRLGLNKNERYDWRLEVKSLTDVARANDFSIEILEESKEKSFASFQQFMGPLSSNANEWFNQKLLKLLEETIIALNANEDETKKTQTAVSYLKMQKNELKLRKELNWHQWVKISKIGVGAKSKDDVEDLIVFAISHDEHPQFHADIEAFINGIFEVAIEALQEYEQYKKSRGLIDYIDMELQVKRLLDHPDVQQVLEEELDLLMVDEFQDTSPIQLEIFYKLSRFAKHSVWVGDPKQSIYGFRGADPKLMQAIIEKQGGVKPEDIQEFSWRSREDVVFATNVIFTKAFSDLKKEQVVLKPKRTKKGNEHSPAEPIQMGNALVHWHFEYDGEKKRPPAGWMENSIATSIGTMLERNTYILPKGEKEVRAARAGDVAVLCRSNFACQKIANSLHKAGIKAAISRTGLLATAEAKLILACLKYILNQADSLSIAELLLLTSSKNVDEIIEDRLQYLEVLKEQPYLQWATKYSIIQELDKLRIESLELSSAEILNLVLEELDLRRIMAGWGDIQQRFDNVDVIRKFALQYEDNCNRLHSAASLGGFLLWLSELENRTKDTQGSGEGPDAVNVVTYHKSKGLEYPIVILYDLEGNLRDKIWGINIESSQDEIDLNNILGNRWLRYWINPYGDQSRKTALMNRIGESDYKAKGIRQAREEEARVLYVGITRARDYLVFPTRGRETKWLNRVWNEGQEGIPTLDNNSHETPWEWNGVYLETDYEAFQYGPDFTTTPISQNAEQYLEKRIGKQDFETYEIDADQEQLKPSLVSQNCLKPQIYSPPLKVKEDAELYRVAKVLKAFLIADQTAYESSERQNIANALTKRFEVGDMVDDLALIRCSNNWYEFLDKTFNITTIWRKYPVQFIKEGRNFSTIIDFIVKTDKAILIIQNSGFSGEKNKWKTKAQELSTWLYHSKSALEEQETTNMPIRTFINFVMSGALMEMEIVEKKNLVES